MFFLIFVCNAPKLLQQHFFTVLRLFMLCEVVSQDRSAFYKLAVIQSQLFASVDLFFQVAFKFIKVL